MASSGGLPALAERKWRHKLALFQLGRALNIMLATTRVFAALLLCALSGHASAEPTSTADFHSRVVELYDFEPHKLDQGGLQAKSAQLDQW